MKLNGGLDPKKLPAISYCKKHGHFINLHPHCIAGCPVNCIAGCTETYQVVCPDCGANNILSKCKTVIDAIRDWNKKYGACAKNET